MGGVAVVVSDPVFSTVIPPEKSAVGSGVRDGNDVRRQPSGDEALARNGQKSREW